MNWLNRFLLANWSHIFDALLLTMALLCGMQIGESRVQKDWDAEKQKIALAQARQEQRVADVRLTQSQITQEISNEYAKRSKLLADRQPDAHVGGVCNRSSAINCFRIVYNKKRVSCPLWRPCSPISWFELSKKPAMQKSLKTPFINSKGNVLRPCCVMRAGMTPKPQRWRVSTYLNG